MFIRCWHPRKGGAKRRVGQREKSNREASPGKLWPNAGKAQVQRVGQKCPSVSQNDWPLAPPRGQFLDYPKKSRTSGRGLSCCAGGTPKVLTARGCYRQHHQPQATVLPWSKRTWWISLSTRHIKQWITLKENKRNMATFFMGQTGLFEE